jgi:hypothetical protein
MSLKHASSVLAWIALGASLALAQPPATPPPAPVPSSGESGASGAPAGGDGIDQILEGEELLLTDTGYNYDPGNRRDPFRSLLSGDTRQVATGPRPEGPAGMLIDEIVLSGIFHTSQGWVAQVLASNKGKSYLIKEGDQLLDGDVVSISRKEVVFKQIVSDPTVIKPFREVVKKLNP